MAEMDFSATVMEGDLSARPDAGARGFHAARREEWGRWAQDRPASPMPDRVSRGRRHRGGRSSDLAGALVSTRHSRASVARMSWRCTTRSTMPVILEVLGALEALGELLADGLFNDPGSGKADQGARLGDYGRHRAWHSWP